MGVARAASDPRARRWIDAASEVTGVDVHRALARGARALSETRVLQPALVAVGLASAEGRRAHVVVGHSLGELTAVLHAAALAPRDALTIAALRGRLMHEAAEARAGAMAIVAHAPEDELESALAELGERGTIAIAGWNAPGETTISGDRALVDVLARRFGARTLRVAGAWHSPHMAPAVEPLRDALTSALRGRRFVVEVCSAERVGPLAIDDAPDVLSEGLVAPVRFAALIDHLDARGVDRAVLAEPARTTRGMLLRTRARGWTFDEA